MTRTLTPEERGVKEGYRSGLEDKIADQLRKLGIDPRYEEVVVEYLKPARKSKYHPDFLLPNGIVIETKGRYITADRQKHLLIKQQHPDLDVRFVFSNSKSRISKGSPTTYAMWCQKNDFMYSDKFIPLAWIEEPPNERRLQALLALSGTKTSR